MPVSLALLGTLLVLVGLDLVCRCFITWLGPINTTRLLFGSPGGQRLALSGEGPTLDIAGSLQLLHASRRRLCSEASMVGGVWDGFLLGHARGEIVPCRFCGGFGGDGHLLWECLHPPLVQIRENPEFHDVVQRDKRNWPRCLLWQGWLPARDGAGGWAVGAGRITANVLETGLGGKPLTNQMAELFLTVSAEVGSGVLSANPELDEATW